MTTQASTIFINDGGQGETPIIFLHSLGGNSAHWAAQLAHTRKMGRAIAFDLPGHGKSINVEPQTLTIKSLVHHLKTALDQLNLEQAILVGHSMGGAVAAAFAGEYPKQVAGLLLVDPPGDSTQMPEEQVQQIIGAMNSDAYTGFIEAYWQQMLQGATESTHTTVMDDLRTTAKDTMIQITKALFKFNPLPSIDQYAGPKQIVAIPATESPFSLHILRPEIQSQLIEGASHWLHMDKPETFNQILNNFMKSL